MIQVIMESKEGTLVMELPRSAYDLYEKIRSIGIQENPNRIFLNDAKENPASVRLVPYGEMDKHLIMAMKSNDTLEAANITAFMIDGADSSIKWKLREKIMTDRYHSCQEIMDDIRQMTYDAGPVKKVFYCPLTGNIDEGDNDYFTVGQSFLRDYQWAIEELLQAEAKADAYDMAEFFNDNEELREKLASVKWGVEAYRGRLFGRIECSLKEPITLKEENILKDWIAGQNSDGWGEHFEQQPIETEDGYLYVSFWHGGSDYSIMDRSELDEYITNQQFMMGGI